MIFFLLIYLLFFFSAVFGILKRSPERILLFIVFSLPLYFTALSIAYANGLELFIPFFQGFKEIAILLTLTVVLLNRKERLKLHIIDWLMISYFVYTLLYVVMPLGSFGFTDRLLAFKSVSFFPFIYFAGRLIDVTKIDFNKYFSYICFVSILAGCVLFVELLRYEHLQTYTGYSEFNRHFFNQDPGGNYGLSWTFETPQGLKRFASFYGGPLEMGVNTVCSASVLVALSTGDDNQFRPGRLVRLTIVFTVFAIFMALSRASFASYFLIIYVYGAITGKKNLLKVFHYTAIVLVLVVLFLLKGDIYEWIINTIDFSDSSSAFHIVQWLDGLQAIGSSPLGLGLGMSGRVAIMTDSNIGGENQLIIIGVQTGVIAVALYVAMYITTIRVCVKIFHNSKGKLRKPALALFLIKLGIIIPMLTANTESYIYLSYLTWFLTGIVVNILMEHIKPDSSETANA